MIGKIGLINDTILETRYYVYEITPIGDTSSFEIQKQDTVYGISKFLQVSKDPIEYLMVGIGYPDSSDDNNQFTIFTFYNSVFQTIWQKTYFLYEGNYTGTSSAILQLQDGKLLYACSPNEPEKKMFLFLLSAEGDSLQYRLYNGNDSTGQILGLTYNYDSTAYWLHTHFAHYDPTGPESQCITLNQNLEQVEVNYYPRWLSAPYSTKLLPQGKLFSGGSFDQPFPNEGRSDDLLAAYILDSTFNIEFENKFTHPDTNAQGATTRSVDYYFANELYLGGNHNNGSFYSQSDSWIYITKLTPELDILYEKYIGGDAYYWLHDIVAANDGGVLLTSWKYDHLIQEHEHDVVIIKLDADGLLTNISNNSGLKITSAIVYPNPGTDKINVRTALKDVKFSLHDINSNTIITHDLRRLITSFNMSNISCGTYFWKVYDENEVYDSGKWIKIN